MSAALKETIAATQDNFRAHPDKAIATFATQSHLQDGLRSDVRIRQHAVVVDEPPQLGGGDAGPNPVELVLAALGACQEITYKAYATALGIELTSVSVALEGDLDLRGFLGVDDASRPGYNAIRGRVTLESTASDAELERLKAVVDRHCPVLDMLTAPVPVRLELAPRTDTA